MNLFFILLEFISKLGGVIEVSPEQKRWAIPIGLFILTVGLIFSFIPKENSLLSQPTPSPTVTQSLSPTESSTIPSGSTILPKENPLLSQSTPSPTVTQSLSPTESSTIPSGSTVTLSDYACKPNEVEAVIDDRDGYTNVRSGQGTEYGIIARVNRDEVFCTIPQQGDWWPVTTKDNTYGYIHRSKIFTK